MVLHGVRGGEIARLLQIDCCTVAVIKSQGYLLVMSDPVLWQIFLVSWFKIKGKASSVIDRTGCFKGLLNNFLMVLTFSGLKASTFSLVARSMRPRAAMLAACTSNLE